jgi:hypothetical protein
MNVRKLVAVVAFATLGAPLAAHADAPSGDFKELFPLNTQVTQPQFPRSEYRAYVEHWIDEQIAATKDFAKTREQVRMEIAAMPLPVIGA